MAVNESLRKTTFQKDGPYLVTKVHGRTVLIDAEGLHNTVWIDRVQLALEIKRTVEATTQAGSPTRVKVQPSTDDESRLGEYVVEKITSYWQNIGINLYKILWLRCTLGDKIWYR